MQFDVDFAFAVPTGSRDRIYVAEVGQQKKKVGEVDFTVAVSIPPQ